MEVVLSRKEPFSRNKRDINVRPLDGDRVVSVFLYSKAGVHVRSTPRTPGAVLGGQPSVLPGRKRLRKVESRCPPSRTEIPAGIPCSKVTLTETLIIKRKTTEKLSVINTWIIGSELFYLDMEKASMFFLFHLL